MIEHAKAFFAMSAAAAEHVFATTDDMCDECAGTGVIYDPTDLSKPTTCRACPDCSGTGKALPCHDCENPIGKRFLNKCHDDGTLRCDGCQDKHMEGPDACDLCYKAFNTDPDASYDAKGVED
jgi:RecJ-like exonuclease